ncbi:hypothetical protein RABR111495_24430 [Rahnella bruchi]
MIAQALDVHPSVIWPSRYFDARGELVEKVLRGNKLTQQAVREMKNQKGMFTADSIEQLKNSLRW